MPSVASAFSFNFLGVANGTPVPPTLTVNVPGYGDVSFTAIGASVLTVDSSFGSNTLVFDSGDTVRVTFLNQSFDDITLNTTDVGITEFFQASNITPNSIDFTLNGPIGGNGAGIEQINFNAVPEPSSSLLGVLGASLLVLRRRR